MEHQSIRDERIAEALEACRPGSKDLAEPELALLALRLETDPELADVFERLQCMDSRLTLAFHDVPIPEGLEDRLLARLAAEKEKPRTISRRRLLAAGGLAAIAAGLLVAVWLGGSRGEEVTEQYVLDEAIRWSEAPLGEHGLLIAEKLPPAGYPFSTVVAAMRGVRWRWVDDFLGRSGVAYDLPCPGDARATLYVLSDPVEGLDIQPSLRPFTTGGCSASAWCENGLLYVLVVQGDPATYQRCLRLPSGPIA